MRNLEQALDWSSRGLAIIAGACLLLMMVHVTLDVGMKYMLNMPIEGTLEIVSRYYMVAAVFLPMAIVELRREHIRVDIFIQLMPPWMALGCYVLMSLLTAGFYWLLAYQTMNAAIRSTSIGEVMMGTSYIAVWPSKWFLPIGFAAVALAVMLHIVKAVLHRGDFDPASDAPVAEP